MPAKKNENVLASIDQLLAKPARRKTIELTIPGDNGNPVSIQVELAAIGAKAYDDMLGANPPTAAQRKEQATYNLDTFAPALISACAATPAMTVAQATELWTSDNWSRGELMELFLGCVEVNSSGLNVPFTESA